MRSWQRFLAVTIATASALQGCALFRPVDLSMHKVVQGLTYGVDKPVPAVDHELLLYAVLKPTLVRQYLDCPAAMYFGRAVKWPRLVELGHKLNGAVDQADWALRLLSWAQDPNGGLPPLGDDPMVPLAFGEAAGQAASYLRELGVDGEDDDRTVALRRKVHAAGQAALERVVAQACAAAPLPGGSWGGRTSLALSGGSANGAFVAGFLFELLMARELTWRDLPSAEKQSFLDSSRFAGVAGTSVGSLLAQLLDLYAIEKLGGARGEASNKFKLDKQGLGHLRYEKDFPPPTQPKLMALVGGSDEVPGDDAQLARQWTLVKLMAHLTDLAEPEAICVQSGPATRVVGYPKPHVPGLMRFDPLQREVIDVLLATVGTQMIHNQFPRVAVSVEVSQNVTVGLDDTACAGLGGGVSNCLAAGIMAATVLPFFAQPVNRVNTGLSQKEDCGIWLDGGLRSGFPVERALLLSRPYSVGERPKLRTLAVSTGRAAGLPSSNTDDKLLDIAKEAIGELGNQVQVSEVLATSHFAHLEQERWKRLSVAMKPPVDAEGAPPEGAAKSEVRQQSLPTTQGGQETALENSPFLEVVFVPRKVPDYFVAGAGYRFDPIVMRGLFVSGQLEAIERAQEAREPQTQEDAPGGGLIERLGWSQSEKVLAHLEADKAALKQWLGRVDASWQERAQARHDAGARRFEKAVESCSRAPMAEEAPPNDNSAPAYFGGNSDTCRRKEQGR